MKKDFNKVPIEGVKHHSIVGVDNYAAHDGIHKNNTDARALSIGIAQWDTENQEEVSAKVFRHTGEKWSPQSEELPLHRCFDLCYLIIQAFKMSYDEKMDFESEELKPYVTDIENLDKIKKFYEENKDILQSKMKKLRNALNDFCL